MVYVPHIRTMLTACFLCFITLSYATEVALNDPYPAKQAQESIYYSSFAERPKTLDPAKSYDLGEHVIIAEIYEPVLQYDYLTRPYKLVPLTAQEMPTVAYFDIDGKEIQDSEHEKVAYSTYTVHIKPGIFYQPHPAFVTNAKGQYEYYPLPPNYLKKHDIRRLTDFKHTATRELVAADYIYEIKRLATPAVNSTIYGLMSQYILGFEGFSEQLPEKGYKKGFIDLRDYDLVGVKELDRYTFEITIMGEYSQFLFWLAMPFFSPIPWEADRFYAQPGMQLRNLSLSWYPVGTGPFLMTENNPNSRIVLARNSEYRPEYFPQHGSKEDVSKGYLRDPNIELPFIDKAIYVLEKESIPRWSKFLQGYYDLSSVTADSYDQAIQVTSAGKPVVSEVLMEKGIRLNHTIEPTIFYLGFNMLDPVVGGLSERARKLRQAISIVVNYEDFITIFLNGRGKVAQGPIPPGIFGYKKGKEGINPVVYKWDGRQKKRRSLREARRLMVEAGYPYGRDPVTQNPLILNYDIPATMGPDDKAKLDWMRNQFAKLGISLNVRATHYNRFQEKMRAGNAQIFGWGWSADYPDPENFLFLLYGPNGKVKFGGENAANYSNPAYDKLFNQIKNRKNDSVRQAVIDEILALLRHDAPWVWGYYSEAMVLSQTWVAPIKPSAIPRSTLKYMRIDLNKRNQLREAWNTPIFWPLAAGAFLMIIMLVPLIHGYQKKQRSAAARLVNKGEVS